MKQLWPQDLQPQQPNNTEQLEFISDGEKVPIKMVHDDAKMNGVSCKSNYSKSTSLL
jgi:hypothetical protein